MADANGATAPAAPKAKKPSVADWSKSKLLRTLRLFNMCNGILLITTGILVFLVSALSITFTTVSGGWRVGVVATAAAAVHFVWGWDVQRSTAGCLERGGGSGRVIAWTDAALCTLMRQRLGRDVALPLVCPHCTPTTPYLRR